MSPTFTVAGLLPFRVMTGASVSGVVVEVVVDVVELPPDDAEAEPARSASSWVRVTQVSPELSDRQISLVRTRFAKKSPTPFAASANHCVSRAKRLEKKADTNGSFPTAGVDVAKSSSLRLSA